MALADIMQGIEQYQFSSELNLAAGTKAFRRGLRAHELVRRHAEAENGELDDVVPMYANNVRFEMTAWDLRMLFGQLMPNSEAKGQVDWHTDVTIPWAQAKLMHLYLGMNLKLYERENGRIAIPPAVLPAPISTPPAGVDTSNPEAIETFTMVEGIIKAFREAQLREE